MRCYKAVVSLPSRPRRVRPFPLAELPRLLRVQVELSRLLWQHILAVIDAAASPLGGLHDLANRLGGMPQIRTVEPYLVPSDRLAAQISGGQVVELTVGRSEREVILVVESALCQRLSIETPDDLTKLLRSALCRRSAGARHQQRRNGQRP